MKYDAFISYDAKESALAASVRQALTDAGLSCVSYGEIEGGEDAQKSLVTAIGEAKTLVFIPPTDFSCDNTLHSEVETAVKLKHTVIPYYRGETQLDDSLGFLTGSYTAIRADEGEDSLARLVAAVRDAKEPPKPKRRRTLIIVAAALVVLAVACALLFVLLRRDPAPTETGPDGELTWCFYEGSGKLVLSGEGRGLDFDYEKDVSEDGTKSPWFEYRDSVKTVVVENGVVEIGWGAFYDMPNLESVSLPDSLTLLSTRTVYHCPKIKELVIPAGVEYVSAGAAGFCDALEKITVCAGVKMFGGAPCQFCPALKTIELDPENRNFKVVDGVLYSSDMTELIQYPAGIDASSFAIPDSVVSLEMCCLTECESLKQITFPEGLTTIKEFALSGAGITEAVLPDGLTEIGLSAFAGCEALTRVQLPEGLTKIDIFAFYGCPSLKEITVPASVTEIGAAAFGYGADEDGQDVKYDFTISGKSGSAAETYAEDYRVTFKAI